MGKSTRGYHFSHVFMTCAVSNHGQVAGDSDSACEIFGMVGAEERSCGWPGTRSNMFFLGLLSLDATMSNIPLIGGWEHVLFSMIYGIILPID